MKMHTPIALIVTLPLLAFTQATLSCRATQPLDELPALLHAHLDSGGSYNQAERVAAALRRWFLVGTDSKEQVDRKSAFLETQCMENGLRVRKTEKTDFDLIYIDKIGEPTDIVSVLSFSYHASKLSSLGVTYIRR